MKRTILKLVAALSVFAAVAFCPAKDVKATTYQDCLKGVHNWKCDYVSVPVTCERNGAHIYFCTICGTAVEKWDIPALGHKMDKGNLIVMPTATTDGFLIYRCEHCRGYMGDQAIPATSAPLPQVVQTPSPALCGPYVQNPLEKAPMYFDTNMMAVCYIPYHSVVTVNGVLANIDAIGAQPLAALMQAPGKYVIKVTPNTNPEHATDNVKTFTVTVPKKAGQAVTVK